MRGHGDSVLRGRGDHAGQALILGRSPAPPRDRELVDPGARHLRHLLGEHRRAARRVDAERRVVVRGDVERRRVATLAPVAEAAVARRRPEPGVVERRDDRARISESGSAQREHNKHAEIGVPHRGDADHGTARRKLEWGCRKSRAETPQHAPAGSALGLSRHVRARSSVEPLAVSSGQMSSHLTVHPTGCVSPIGGSPPLSRASRASRR